MYSRTAKQALRAIVDESNDLIRSPAGKALKPGERNKLVDRIVFELWMRGFAVSARTSGLKPGLARDDHEAWRNRKLGRRIDYTQTDIGEVRGKKPSQAAGGYQDAPAT